MIKPKQLKKDILKANNPHAEEMLTGAYLFSVMFETPEEVLIRLYRLSNELNRLHREKDKGLERTELIHFIEDRIAELNYIIDELPF